MIDDRELFRIYLDHHAKATDRRSCKRLAALMRQSRIHDATCQTPNCPVTLRSFLHGEVVHDMVVNNIFLQSDPLEDDERRQEMKGGRFVLRIYVPPLKSGLNGLMVA